MSRTKARGGKHPWTWIEDGKLVVDWQPFAEYLIKFNPQRTVNYRVEMCCGAVGVGPDNLVKHQSMEFPLALEFAKDVYHRICTPESSVPTEQQFTDTDEAAILKKLGLTVPVNFRVPTQLKELKQLLTQDTETEVLGPAPYAPESLQELQETTLLEELQDECDFVASCLDAEELRDFCPDLQSPASMVKYLVQHYRQPKYIHCLEPTDSQRGKRTTVTEEQQFLEELESEYAGTNTVHEFVFT